MSHKVCRAKQSWLQQDAPASQDKAGINRVTLCLPQPLKKIRYKSGTNLGEFEFLEVSLWCVSHLHNIQEQQSAVMADTFSSWNAVSSLQVRRTQTVIQSKISLASCWPIPCTLHIVSFCSSFNQLTPWLTDLSIFFFFFGLLHVARLKFQ